MKSYGWVGMAGKDQHGTGRGARVECEPALSA